MKKPDKSKIAVEAESDEEELDLTPALIIHGASSTKIGFGGEKYPRFVFPEQSTDLKVRIRRFPIEGSQTTDDSVVFDLAGGLPVKVNAHWARLSYDVRIDAYGIGDEYLTARWTFSRSGGPLSISEDEYFAVTLRDDFTGLVDQSFMLQGRIIKATN